MRSKELKEAYNFGAVQKSENLGNPGMKMLIVFNVFVELFSVTIGKMHQKWTS